MVLLAVALEEIPDHVGGVIRLKVAPMGRALKTPMDPPGSEGGSQGVVSPV